MFLSTVVALCTAIIVSWVGVVSSTPTHDSRINYTTVTGYFLQDEASTNTSTFSFINTNFGLINRTYATDATYDPNGKKTQWQRFEKQVFRFNRDSGRKVQYKLLFMGRHGEGYHNAAESYYGTPAWNCYWSLVDGNGTVRWDDARLTPQGVKQALAVNAFWASELKNQKIPPPRSYYTSPLTRCLATANLTFSGLQLPSRHPFVPTVKEFFREGISGHTCDRRGTRTYIQQAFPKYKIEPGFTEADQLWQAYHREVQIDQDIRSKAVLDDVFSTDSETQFHLKQSHMMAVVRALDDYYLAITLLITIAYQLFFFSIAFSLKFDKLTDFAGGTNFVVLAIITLAFSGHHHARQIVCSLFIMLWGARLSGFLLFRIIKTGKDDRFDDKRDKFWSFLGFWVFQMIWVWIVSLPVTILNSPNVTKFNQPAFGTGRDIAGVILFAIGFILESVSDIQKYQFRSKPENKGKVCDIGFFTWTRHPNYFGEIIIQFAIFMIAVSPSAYGYVTGGAFSAQYAAILGAFFLTLLLMFVSGLTLQERPGAKKRYESGNHWESFSRYTKRTSILIPFPPQLYEPMPTILKRTLFLEFPIYVFDPAKHADQSKVRDREAEERDSHQRQDGQGGQDGHANGQ
ncbi:MAG: hypothetical protein LQ339_005058 [Xanthoria mediterranea]|nr:MAG: hypothetical protein LQ339_005058 [Xanthoria mediterranea]